MDLKQEAHPPMNENERLDSTPGPNAAEQSITA